MELIANLHEKADPGLQARAQGLWDRGTPLKAMAHELGFPSIEALQAWLQRHMPNRKPRKTTITPELLARAAELVAAGSSKEEIARGLGLPSAQAAANLLHKHFRDRPVRKDRATAQQMATLADMAARGRPAEEVARALGITADRARRMLDRYHPGHDRPRGFA